MEFNDKVKTLKKKQGDLYIKMREIDDLCAAEERDKTYKEQNEIDDLIRQSDMAETQIANIQAEELQGAKVVQTADLSGMNFNNAGTRAIFESQQASKSDIDYSQFDSGGFSCLGEMMLALNQKHKGEGYDDRLRALKIVALDHSSETGSLGGFLIPLQFIVRAFTDHLQDVVLLRLCDKEKMTANTLVIPTMPDSDHSSTQPFGITWSQVPEGGTIGYTNTRFGQLKLTAKKSGALFTFSNEMMRDAPGPVMQRIEDAFYKSLQWYIEGLLWNGTGAGQPLGALNAPGTLEIAKQATQAAGCKTIVTENIVELWARLKPGSHNKAIWVANQTCFPQLATMTVNVGTGGTTTGLLDINHSVVGEPATTIYGRPLYFSEHLPTVGTAGDIVLLDPNEYLFGDRQQISLDTSSHVKFASDETVYRALARLDGQPKLASTIVPANGDEVSWAVKIADR